MLINPQVVSDSARERQDRRRQAALGGLTASNRCDNSLAQAARAAHASTLKAADFAGQPRRRQSFVASVIIVDRSKGNSAPIFRAGAALRLSASLTISRFLIQ